MSKPDSDKGRLMSNMMDEKHYTLQGAGVTGQLRNGENLYTDFITRDVRRW